VAKYDVTHSCGHTARYNLIGPHRTREWRIQCLQKDPCPDCFEAERQRRNREAAEANRAAELPALRGSEKQIIWAESIRARLIAETEESVQTLGDADPSLIERLCTQDMASWWIDRRELSVRQLLREMQGPAQKPTTFAGELREQEVALAAKAAATLRPEAARTETVAEIRAVGDTLIVEFAEKREDFRQLMRQQLRFTWANTHWARKMTTVTGSILDRLAETGHRLLAAGFPIRIYDDTLRAKAIAGDYEPEQRRWVQRRMDGQYAGWFVLSWPREANLFSEARRLRGSRYLDGKTHVPAEQYEQVLAFAERYGFRLSPGAVGLADQARTVRELSLVTPVAPIPVPDPPAPAGNVPPVLGTPDGVGVSDALRDN